MDFACLVFSCHVKLANLVINWNYGFNHLHLTKAWDHYQGYNPWKTLRIIPEAFIHEVFGEIRITQSLQVSFPKSWEIFLSTSPFVFVELRTKKKWEELGETFTWSGQRVS